MFTTQLGETLLVSTLFGRRFEFFKIKIYLLLHNLN